MHWTTTPQSFIALGFSQASIKIQKTWSFPTSCIIQTVVNPVKFLRASLNFTIKNIFFKSNLNTSRFYMHWTTTPQSFIALGFLQASIKIQKTWSFPTSCIMQAVVNPVKFLRASLNFTIKYFFLIQFKYEQILHALDYHPIEFHSIRIFIGFYKNLENLVISHVLYHAGCCQPG